MYENQIISQYIFTTCTHNFTINLSEMKAPPISELPMDKARHIRVLVAMKAEDTALVHRCTKKLWPSQVYSGSTHFVSIPRSCALGSGWTGGAVGEQLKMFFSSSII